MVYKYVMIGLIKSMRIPDCLLLVAAGLIGFKYAGMSSDILTLITLFFVITVTMLQNDWRDRRHDISKGKTFASSKPSVFIGWLIFFWVLCIILLVVLFLEHSYAGILLTAMAIIGAIYSETRRIPFLPVTLVTLTVASSTLLPLAFGVDFTSVAPLFVAMGLIIFGRETLHDIADIEADKNYKKTIPIIMGDKFARVVATIALIIGCGLLFTISPITIIGSTFIVWGLTGVRSEIHVVQTRKRVDVGLLLFAASLILF